MKKLIFFCMVTATHAALAQMPAHMVQSAQAAYQQQQAQHQQLMGHIYSNIQRCGDAHGYGCQQQTPVQAPPARPIESHLVGLHDQYGAIAISYRDDILLDNYSHPLPFSWERYRDMRSDINGMRLEDLSPLGYYQPFRIHTAGEFRNQPTHAQHAEAAARERCEHQSCEIAAVYRNSCNAIAVGWLKDYSGVRLYTASRPHSAPTYRKGDVNDSSLASTLADSATQDAIARCQRDPAVHAQSCEAPPEHMAFCALPSETLEWR